MIFFNVVMEVAISNHTGNNFIRGFGNTATEFSRGLGLQSFILERDIVQIVLDHLQIMQITSIQQQPDKDESQGEQDKP